VPVTREVLASTAGEVGLLHAEGRLDAAATPALESELEAALASGQTRLIVDLAGATYISSSSLRALLGAWRRVHARGGDLVLAGLRPRVREVFEMIGFDHVFTIRDTTEQALSVLLPENSAS